MKKLEKRVVFATTNAGKAREAASVLQEFGVRVEPEPLELAEERADSIEHVARQKAVAAFAALRRPVVVDDTGFFLSAYNSFPGVYSKWVFKALGIEGLLKLVAQGTSRKAFFKTAVAFCGSAGKASVFSGVALGSVSVKAGPVRDASLPYDALFIPAGGSRVYSLMSESEKLARSSRAMAFRAFGKWFSGSGK